VTQVILRPRMKALKAFVFLLVLITVTGKSLPTGPIIQGYVNIGFASSVDSIVNTTKSGVNVLTWSFINLVANNQGQPVISPSSSNFGSVATVIKTITSAGFSCTHLISIGGWDAPHPDTKFNAQTWWNTFKSWNDALQTSYGFQFDGIDWDTEGEDTVNGPDNYFSIQLLDLIGGMSQLAKSAGYIVTVVPAQSYLDCENNAFSLYVNNSQSWAPTFYYHGYNVYAYLIAKYDQYIDAVLLQVYEGWSRAGYDTSFSKSSTDIGTYFKNLVHNLTVTGWNVRFSQVPSTGLPDQIIKIAPQKLIVALGNGWAAPMQGPNFTEQKFPLFWPEDIQPSWNPNLYRGYGYWVVDDEGWSVSKYNAATGKSTQYPLFLAHDLNSFVHVRD